MVLPTPEETFSTKCERNKAVDEFLGKQTEIAVPVDVIEMRCDALRSCQVFQMFHLGRFIYERFSWSSFTHIVRTRRQWPLTFNRLSNDSFSFGFHCDACVRKNFFFSDVTARCF